MKNWKAIKKPKQDDYIPRAKLLKVGERDNWVCWLCGGEVPNPLWHNRKSPLVATLDHYLPKAKNGRGVSRNMKLAHKFCNSRRGQKMPTEEDWPEFIEQLKADAKLKFERFTKEKGKGNESSASQTNTG